MKASFAYLSIILLLVNNSQVKAVGIAPSSTSGDCFEITVTGGDGPFAKSGYYLALPANSGNGYSIIGIQNVVSFNGTSDYFHSNSIGTSIFTDPYLSGATETMTYTANNLGNFYVSLGTNYQSGTFTLFSNSAPISVSGKIVTFNPTIGAYPFASNGNATLTLSETTNSYTIKNGGGT